MYKDEIVFQGRLLKLYKKRERYPSGHIADLEVVVHPGAVLIVPFLKKDKIVFIRQYRPVIKSFIWELPAGTLKKSERPLSCAKRELVEEIGYIAGKWERIGYIYPAPGYTTEKITIYKAGLLQKTEAIKEDDEIIEPMAFSKKEIIHMINIGRIVDAKTLCALLLCGLI